MKVEIKTIVENILARLNENPVLPDELTTYGEPWMDLRVLIETQLVGVAERVIIEADVSEIGEWYPLEGGLTRSYVGEAQRMVLVLPDDYLRLVYIRMSDWQEDVSNVMTSRSDLASYRRFRDRRRCSERRPVLLSCYYNRRRALEILGSEDDATLAEGGYLPRPHIEQGTLVFPHSLSGLLVERMVETIKKIRE